MGISRLTTAAAAAAVVFTIDMLPVCYAQAPGQLSVPLVLKSSKTVASRAVSGLTQRRGIGTTPFLRNSCGLGAYSVNFDNAGKRSLQQSRWTLVNSRRFRNWR